MTTHNSWRGTCVGSASLLLSISHSIETLASVGEETKEESMLSTSAVFPPLPFLQISLRPFFENEIPLYISLQHG